MRLSGGTRGVMQPLKIGNMENVAQVVTTVLETAVTMRLDGGAARAAVVPPQPKVVREGDTGGGERSPM